MIRKTLLCSLILLTTSCANITSSHDKYSNEEHLLYKLDSSDDGFFEEYKASYEADKTGSNTPTISLRYLNKGIALSRSVCYDFLDEMTTGGNNSKFSQNETGVLVLLASGIMGLNGVNADSFTRLALVGTAINSTFELYNNHYLLGEDGDVIIDLIKQAMMAAESEIKTKSPQTFIDAYTLLESYSRVCSNSTIRRLVRDSLKKAIVIASSENADKAEETALTEIAQLFGAFGLSKQQLLGLYWYSHEASLDTDAQNAVNDALGTNLSSIILNVANKDKVIKSKEFFAKIPSFSNNLQNIIDDTKLKRDYLTQNNSLALSELSDSFKSFATKINWQTNDSPTITRTKVYKSMFADISQATFSSGNATAINVEIK
jgi:hypothetical protein